jgi:hypothetical protein
LMPRTDDGCQTPPTSPDAARSPVHGSGGGVR